MKTPINVENREEGRLIRAGLARPDIRAFVKIMGALDELPSDSSRRRVLSYTVDRLNEEKRIAHGTT